MTVYYAHLDQIVSTEILSTLERKGLALVPSVIDESVRLDLLRDMQKSVSPVAAGVRDVTRKIDSVRSLTHSKMIRALVEPVLGSSARLVRSILFNKSEDANWQVAWHQDLAIAVEKRVEIDGFTCWSIKNGTPHVQPPVQILEHMLNVRVHLDDADETNGALWVSPGSHHLGRIPANEAAGTANHLGTQLCAAAAGDVLLFRPLTLHASKKAISNHPRRVIHLEFAGVALPLPLKWSEAA